MVQQQQQQTSEIAADSRSRRAAETAEKSRGGVEIKRAVNPLLYNVLRVIVSPSTPSHKLRHDNIASGIGSILQT
jgi:hypothetical protein